MGTYYGAFLYESVVFAIATMCKMEILAVCILMFSEAHPKHILGVDPTVWILQIL